MMTTIDDAASGIARANIRTMMALILMLEQRGHVEHDRIMFLLKGVEETFRKSDLPVDQFSAEYMQQLMTEIDPPSRKPQLRVVSEDDDGEA